MFGLEKAQLRWEMSIWAQIDMVKVGDEHLGLKKCGQGGERQALRLKETQMGDEHPGLKKHGQGGRR